MLDRLFGLAEHNTSVRTEIIAGITTFLTMAHIIFVNPQILADAGMDHGAVFVATCLAAAAASLFMGLYANYPIAMAPGMGLNAYFTYTVVGQMHYSWQVALGAVFLSGILFLIVSVLPIREAIVNSIPRSLKMAISAGIGLFLGIIALQKAGVVVPNPGTMIGIGDLKATPTILATIGFIVLAALVALRVTGAIIIAILGITAVGVLLGVTSFSGVIDLPPSLAPTFLQLDLSGAMQVGLISIVFAFFFVDLFDNAGTLIGVAHRAGLLDAQGRLPRLRKALLADSTMACLGSALGTSTVTSYVESAAGVNAGGRTGLTAVVVAILFLLSLFLAPLATSIPAFATAPALLFVACLMTRGLSEIDWEDATEFVPAVVCALAMPLTYSIAHGIAFGFITYVGIKLLSGRVRDIHPAVGILAVLFVVKFALI